MKDELQAIFNDIKDAIKSTTELHALAVLQAQALGKKSKINELFQSMRNVDYKTTKEMGALINKVKNDLIVLFDEAKGEMEKKEIEAQLAKDKIDINLPSDGLTMGNSHPLNLIIDEISEIFEQLGYDMVFGQEIESDEYNFQRLNLPKNHPARDMQDTFYINDNLVLRTHCTNMTARMISEMKNENEPIAVISAGNVYRRDDDDATHSHQFTQIDGFVIGPGISFANLKWTLQYFCKRIFGEATQIRLRPSYFPFTEPSVEVDVTCVRCAGKGCGICKQTGFIEILGAGMISPKVFQACHKSDKLTGFAFGLGIERIAMLKYGIEDIRQLYTNDLRFLKMFKAFN